MGYIEIPGPEEGDPHIHDQVEPLEEDEEDYPPDSDYDFDADWDGSRLDFADPGGNSALRAASPSNPRNLPCPTCGRENMLTPKDVALHYQCDYCADAAEGLSFSGEY